MDTRYWGPSGWRLLHLIAHGGRGPLERFFSMLPYVLPCKYCRKSLSEYIQADPIPSNVEDFPRWVWRIHNDVNAKLRQQGISTTPDPPFNRVQSVYEDRIATGCSRTTFEGWEFLFSVAEAHPFSAAGRASTAIHGAPPDMTCRNPLERNRWNYMTPDERLPFYNRFWELLPDVLPFPEWTKAWKQAAGKEAWECRATCLKRAWGVRRHMEESLQLLNRTRFSELCKTLRANRSGCGYGSKGKTCRRRRRGPGS